MNLWATKTPKYVPPKLLSSQVLKSWAYTNSLELLLVISLNPVLMSLLWAQGSHLGKWFWTLTLRLNILLVFSDSHLLYRFIHVSYMKHWAVQCKGLNSRAHHLRAPSRMTPLWSPALWVLSLSCIYSQVWQSLRMGLFPNLVHFPCPLMSEQISWSHSTISQ